jgi:uncharacterized membrane protein YgcG
MPFSCTESNPSPSATTAAAPSSAPAAIVPSDAGARLNAIRARAFGALDHRDGSTSLFEATGSGSLLAIPSPRTTAKTASVELPGQADGPVRITDDASRFSVTFALVGAAKVSIGTADGIAVYAAAAPGGGDVLHRVSPSGTEDFVFFGEAPPIKEVRYRVDVGAVAGLRLVAGALELLDSGGTPRLRVSPPYVLDADGVRHAASLAVVGCAVDTSPRAPWGRPVTSPGASSCGVTVGWPDTGIRYPALVDPVWGTTFNSMETARTRHTITLLNPSDPKSAALIVGGFATVGGAPLKTAELYDPLSRRFSPTGSMNTARGNHTATLLTKVTPPSQLGPADPVLVAGGNDAGTTPLDSLEVYDPASGTFLADPLKMTAYPRFNHTATLVADRQVLLAGGITLPLNQPTNTAYLYTFTGFIPGNPAPTGLMSTLADAATLMQSSRSAHAAVRLNTGDVLLTGGFVLAGGAFQALQSAELWNHTSGAFEAITTLGGGLPQMSFQRGFHAATLLGSGTVLVTGGLSKTVGGIYTDTIDLYADGATGAVKGFVPQVIPITMGTGRSNHTATLLTTGDVLIAGGFSGVSSLASTEIFSVKSQKFSPLAALNAMLARGDHAALLINAGDSVIAGRSVLVTGGSTSATVGAAARPDAQILLQINGDACIQDDECLSGHCADVSTLDSPNAGKMCCDTSCNEVCRSCSAAVKGTGVDGVCGPSSNGTNLGWSCVPKLGEEVEIRQGCDGKGAVIPFATNKCTPNQCNGTRCATDCPCSDAGFCTDAAAPVTPSSSSSSSSSGTGGAGGSSSGAGGGSSSSGAGSPGLHCEDRLLEGLACSEGRQCNSGYCVDGYCCNLACTGQCEACDVVGKYGFCTAAGTLGAEPPHLAGGSIDFSGKLTTRQACAGTDTGCAGLCGGVKTDGCIYPGTEKVSKAPSCDKDAVGVHTATSFSCDGQGKEVTAQASCDGFLCDSDTACKTTCAADTDCIADHVCLGGDAGMKTCQPLTGPLCDGGNILRQPASKGGPVKCPDHFTCPADATACLTRCDSVKDCADGLVCNNAQQCVARIPALTDLASCSTSQPGRPGEATITWALALLALAVARRRAR